MSSLNIEMVPNIEGHREGIWAAKILYMGLGIEELEKVYRQPRL